MYQQQNHQGLQQGVGPQPVYQVQQHFSDNPPYTDGGSAGAMACLYQSYQVGGVCALAGWVSFAPFKSCDLASVSPAGDDVAPTVRGWAAAE